MAKWSDYLDVRESKGDDAAWKFAQKNFPRDSQDYESARRFHKPSKQDRRESEERQRSIANVSQREIRENCQFDGLPGFGKR